jgi:ADP-ribosylglycohydrolase
VVAKLTSRSEVIRGCLLGALVGDAAGATLEFLGRQPDAAEVDRALEMVGGGPLRVAPGQVTDDGELTLCLARALAGTTMFSIEKVALEYLAWLRSDPFDIGNATRNGLSGGLTAAPGKVHEGMWHAAAAKNAGSKANGALMRASSLGAWGWRLSEDDLVVAAMTDCGLTHPHPTCKHASALYCLAIRHLALNPGDGAGAFTAAEGWAQRLHADEVGEWLGLAERNVDVGFWPQAGFVKYGFVHAFRHLLLGTPYRDALRETLFGGGDTDTNACIVGGLVGALHGEPGIPRAMAEVVTSCDTEKGRPRPAWLRTCEQLPRLFDALVE